MPYTSKNFVVGHQLIYRGVEQLVARQAHNLEVTRSSRVSATIWKDGRVVDYTGLENRRAERHRGFESLSFRIIWNDACYRYK